MALCASATTARAGLMVACDAIDWRLTVSAPSADREMAARLVAVALEASGEAGTVTVVDGPATDASPKLKDCAGFAHLQLTRSASGVLADLVLTKRDSMGPESTAFRSSGK